jgi:hypothetical protein
MYLRTCQGYTLKLRCGQLEGSSRLLHTLSFLLTEVNTTLSMGK